MGWRSGLLGFEHGIVQAPLGPDISGPQLVAAVANAGAIGLLRAPDSDSPELVRKLIRQTRILTERPFGIGVILSFPHKENIRVILEERVEVMLVYYGDYPRELVDEAHKFGVKVIHQVGSLEDAEKAVAAGVDAIIVQGVEAGGHGIGKESLVALLPRVADLIQGHDIPIIAAGGIVDARGYVAALALGAQGVCIGTRFVATNESNAHPFYKQKLVEASNTEYTDIFGRARWPGAGHRVLVTNFFNSWKYLPANVNEVQQPTIGHTKVYEEGLKTKVKLSKSDFTRISAPYALNLNQSNISSGSVILLGFLESISAEGCISVAGYNGELLFWGILVSLFSCFVMDFGTVFRISDRCVICIMEMCCNCNFDGSVCSVSAFQKLWEVEIGVQVTAKACLLTMLKVILHLHIRS